MSNADRSARIERMRQLPRLLEALVLPLSTDQLQARPLAGEWSVAQNVHHVADSHMNAYIRTKLILTEESPPLKGYQQDRWAETVDGTMEDLRASLELLAGLHARWTKLLESLPHEAWARAGIHSETQKPVSLDDILVTYSGHGESHLDQIARTLAAQTPVEAEGKEIASRQRDSIAAQGYAPPACSDSRRSHTTAGSITQGR